MTTAPTTIDHEDGWWTRPRSSRYSAPMGSEPLTVPLRPSAGRRFASPAAAREAAAAQALARAELAATDEPYRPLTRIVSDATGLDGDDAAATAELLSRPAAPTT
jgi:hypothetical protein